MGRIQFRPIRTKKTLTAGQPTAKLLSPLESLTSWSLQLWLNRFATNSACSTAPRFWSPFPIPSVISGKEARSSTNGRGFVKTAGVTVVGELVQNRERPHPGTCLGKGKMAELKELAEATGAELIIFDNNLSPSQGRNLEQETKRIIVDRSELILDIFATDARTYESKLQVELVQLQYTRTRLKRMWTHLERIDGGIGASRGPGEKQIETDRRIIDTRIAELKERLKDVEIRRERMVRQRDGHSLVSLVGYTNAGKSTLMRALTGADVYIADQLFSVMLEHGPAPGQSPVGAMLSSAIPSVSFAISPTRW